jgi:hypothetical protein
VTQVLGIDPGPKPGAVLVQVAGGLVVHAGALRPDQIESMIPAADLVSLERFIVGRGTLRKTKAGTVETLAQIEQFRAAAQAAGVRLVQYPAGTVKPWATDERLRAYGCYVAGDHHRDAARHALFAAVRSGLLPRRPVDTGNGSG